MKTHLWNHTLSLLFMAILLLLISACGSTNQTSARPQATPSPDTISLNDPAATTVPGATPHAQATSSVTSTPTNTHTSTTTSTSKTTTTTTQSIPTPTPKATTIPPTPTPTTSTIAIPTPTPTTAAIPVYHQVGSMPVASANKGSWNFDISWVDQASNMYYLADRDSKGIDVFNISTSQFVTTITGFSGPNGVVADNQGQLWVGDSDSTVKAINLQTDTIIATIPTGGKQITDEIAYDPQDQYIMAANGDDSPSFVTIISATTHTIVKKVTISGAEGLEQPAWDAQAHLFYISIPKTTQSPGGAIAVINPQAGSVINTIPLSSCNPTGFAIGPNGQALIGCDGHPVIVDLSSWNVLTTISQSNGCDEVWYNPGDQHYYLAADANNSGPSLSVVDAQTFQLIQNAPTKSGAHSVAADTGSNTILVPIAGIGIAIYAAQ